MSESNRNHMGSEFETEEERRARIRRKKRKKEQQRKKAMLLTTLLVVLAVVLIVLILIPKKKSDGDQKAASSSATSAASSAEGSQGASSSASQATQKTDMTTLLSNADRLAKMYDYDKAIEMLQSSPYASETEVKAMVSTYEADKAELKDYDHSKITHIFFHSLIVDNKIAFSSSNASN
ncbi:MAG: hypothetical protein II745_05800, partial [Lachnospiraceae bacterium]|nr:hypothetical protein [Lachnospiraceae bacterium]